MMVVAVAAALDTVLDTVLKRAAPHPSARGGRSSSICKLHFLRQVPQRLLRILPLQVISGGGIYGAIY